ncbi:TIGR03915 family putative DNA repair protein [Pedobacter arcticus]|uniref:TIGR03915 family putative DNA repair protein n=1 Tax=Pedobacter arcticus TaxID=752140 RepID=UPI0002E291CE|nr:TIGR03915 family putative DNA repair protein [Pedobacter arcticus]
MITLLTYDHSLDGFFTAVFEVYEYKIEKAEIRKEALEKPALFYGLHRVITDPKKAERVFKKLKMLLGEKGIHQIIYSLLTEDEHCERPILEVIKYAIANPEKKVLSNMTNQSVLKLERYTKQVGREKHRMEAFVRFRLITDQIYFAEIEPDFNVMPIIAKHFAQRYQDQKWLIFDQKRQYGLFYNLQTVETVEMDFSDKTKDLEMLGNDEDLYQNLWRTYFDKTNIKARKNTRLHIQHVPKRYWKYLTEKQPF